MKYLLLLITLLAPLSLAAQGLSPIKQIPKGFSIYIQRPAKGMKAVPKKLFYGYGDKQAVPIIANAGRQSILYPLKQQSRLSLFTMEIVDGKEKRNPVGSVSVPASATRGVLILNPTSKGVRITDFWVNPNERDGSIRLQNLLSEPVAFQINDAKKPIALKPNKSTTVKGEFQRKESHACFATTVFKFDKKKKNKLKKASELMLHVRKKQKGLVFVLPRTKSTITTLNLVDEGAINYRAQEELVKHLPAFAKKKKKASEAPAGPGA